MMSAGAASWKKLWKKGLQCETAAANIPFRRFNREASALTGREIHGFETEWATVSGSFSRPIFSLTLPPLNIFEPMLLRVSRSFFVYCTVFPASLRFGLAGFGRPTWTATINV